MKRILSKKVVLCFIGVIFALWTVWGNVTVGISRYEIINDRLPAAFDGYKIVQISDFHNSFLGEEVVKILTKEKPDIIAFTGDLVDSVKTDVETALTLVKAAVKIAPCYYVTGNHEARLGEVYAALERELKAAGVRVLRNETAELVRGMEAIQLIGLDDPLFAERDEVLYGGVLERKLRGMELSEGFKLLLSHRPEAFEAYVANDIQAVLSGHTHGGQIRLPFLGAIVAPDQGFFPEYDAGLVHQKDTDMIISRGIGNSRIPIRFNNRPEVVAVVLKKTEG